MSDVTIVRIKDEPDVVEKFFQQILRPHNDNGLVSLYTQEGLVIISIPLDQLISIIYERAP